MSAPLYFLLLSAIYTAPRVSPEWAGLMSVAFLLLAILSFAFV
jgi:hypothetical protein